MTGSIILDAMVLGGACLFVGYLMKPLARMAWHILVLLTPFGIVAFFHLIGEVIRAVHKARAEQDDSIVDRLAE